MLKSQEKGFGMAGAILVLAALFILFMLWMYKDGLFSVSEQVLNKIRTNSQTNNSILRSQTRNLTKPAH